MPLRNRVDPYGILHAVDARGAWMGNRGILHDEAKRIVVPWRLKRWITCTLSFRGRQRRVFAPHSYSELFFLDEATSFAAGHRPCAECRRGRYNEFRAAWIAVNADGTPNRRLGADDIDAVLHRERVIRGGEKRTWRTQARMLPAGTIVEHGTRPHLIWAERLWPWSFSGYGKPAPLTAAAAEVTVLTPPSTVLVFSTGFRPQVHESVDA